MIRLVGFERTVSDLARSEAFYVGHLGFACLERRMGEVVLERGGRVLTLQAGLAVTPPARACDPGFQHLALPVRDMAEAVAALPEGVGWFSRGGPQRLPARSGGVVAAKFRDPDGQPLELIQFPDGTTDGIDHSALVVADAARSLAFYAELGLSPVARQVNRGIEQDRLDALDGAVVEVIALEGTPHVELLAYRHPAVPAGPRASATRLVFRAEGREGVLGDPDGHVLRLIRD